MLVSGTLVCKERLDAFDWSQSVHMHHCKQNIHSA